MRPQMEARTQDMPVNDTFLGGSRAKGATQVAPTLVRWVASQLAEVAWTQVNQMVEIHGSPLLACSLDGKTAKKSDGLNHWASPLTPMTTLSISRRKWSRDHLARTLDLALHERVFNGGHSGPHGSTTADVGRVRRSTC